MAKVWEHKPFNGATSTNEATRKARAWKYDGTSVLYFINATAGYTPAVWDGSNYYSLLSANRFNEKMEAFDAYVNDLLKKVEAKHEREIATVKERLGQAERDIELLWDLHRRPEHLGDRTFLTSSAKRFYSRELAFADKEKMWANIEDILAEFYVDKGQRGSADAHAKSFATTLRQGVESNPGSATPALSQTCPWLATRAWTSTVTDPVFDREWCSILNQITREDKAKLVQKSSRVVATMAGFNVVDRTKAAPPVQWPESWTLTRGCRLPDQHRDWYEGNIGQWIRIPMFLATTKLADLAKDFMNNFSYPKDMPKALFYLKLDPNLRCDHVHCVESLTLAPGEQEFLFPPSSAFKILSVQRLMGCTEITMEVANSNLEVPEDAPWSPWA